MDINYHYYTIKTLAIHAGFDDEKAQFIAHFSQHIDDFIMHSPFIVDKEPPDFFHKNGLANKIKNNKWVFSPCATGLNLIHTVSHSYQLDTLMPFHFITPKVNRGMPQNTDRGLYRCRAANENDNLLINQLMENTAKSVKPNDKTSLMALGMLLHTLSDTYAHCGFSGFHGWENESYIHKMTHKIPQIQIRNIWPIELMKEKLKETVKENLNKNLKVKLREAKESLEAMSPAEKAFYRALPSIGHANVSHAPDCCDCYISIYGKRTKDGALELLIERDNSVFFAECSRRVLDILCTINEKPKFNDIEWANLQEKLAVAQNSRTNDNSKTIRRKWMEIFPNINYSYKKNEFIRIELNLVHHDTKLTDRLEVSKSELTDIYSEKGDKARISSLILARNVNDLFYTYNELAYRHVFNVNGGYASHSNFTRLSTYSNLVLAATV